MRCHYAAHTDAHTMARQDPAHRAHPAIFGITSASAPSTGHGVPYCVGPGGAARVARSASPGGAP